MIGTFGKFNMAGPPTFPLRHFRSALAADCGWAIAEWLSRYCPTCLRVAKFRPVAGRYLIQGGVGVGDIGITNTTI
jgi:hypothetical protein